MLKGSYSVTITPTSSDGKIKVKSLEKSQKDKFGEILYDHAKLMEGENLDDPKKYTNLIAELVSL